MTASWIEDARHAALLDVAAALGLEQDRAGRALHPCPGCGAERRGSRDPRGPVGLTPDRGGWRCFRCGAGGDGLDLVATRMFVGRLRDLTPENVQDVRDWYAERGWCSGNMASENTPASASAPTTTAAPPPPTDLQIVRPPASEVVELWDACDDVYDDGEVSAWLAYRGLDTAKVSDLNLARALPPTGSLPAWARCAGRPWSAGWRCIFPVYDATGTLASLRARWCRLLARGEAPAGQLDRPPEEFPAVKSAAAAAGPGSASGLVLADGLLRQLLRTGEKPHWWPEATPLRIVVVEGEPDFLTWATRHGDAAETAPAVLGLWSGAWTSTLAACIPTGCRILLRTDLDANGHHYATKVARDLADRCELRRLSPEAA